MSIPAGPRLHGKKKWPTPDQQEGPLSNTLPPLGSSFFARRTVVASDVSHTALVGIQG
jgi:hypothetical protein